VASKYSIQAVYKLIDNISAPLDRIAGKGNAVGKALKNDFLSAQRSLDRMGQSLAMVGKLAIGAGVAAVGAGIAVATKQYIEFDDALHKAGAVFSDLDPKLDTFKNSLSALGAEARKVVAATEFNAQQAAAALSTMAMAGIKSDQAIALLSKTANLATAAGIELNEAASMAADSLNVFNMMSDDPAKLAGNFEYISDILVKASSIANMDIGLMFEAASKGGAQFTKANQSIEDFGAAIDALASKNIKGAEAGRAVNVMMTRLAAPAKAGADAIKNLGLVTTDADGNLLNFIDNIGQMENKLKGMGTAQVAGYINDIFGKQYLTQATAFIDIGADKLRDYSAQLRDAAGSAAQMADVMRRSIKNKIEILKSALTELGNKFVEAFYEKGVSFIEKLTEAVSQFNPQPIIDGLTTAASVIGYVTGTIWNFRHIILGVALAWGIYEGAQLAAAAAAKIFDMVTNASSLKLIITAIGILIGLLIGEAIRFNTPELCSG
jgi:TP901 family phage tail tape measure protein